MRYSIRRAGNSVFGNKMQWCGVTHRISNSSFIWIIPQFLVKLDERFVSHYSPSCLLNAEKWSLELQCGTRSVDFSLQKTFSIERKYSYHRPDAYDCQISILNADGEELLSSAKFTQRFRSGNNFIPFSVPISEIRRNLEEKAGRNGIISIRVTLEPQGSVVLSTPDMMLRTWHKSFFGASAVHNVSDTDVAQVKQHQFSLSHKSEPQSHLETFQRVKQVRSGGIQTFDTSELTLENTSKQQLINSNTTSTSNSDDVPKLLQDFKDLLLSEDNCDVTLKVKEKVFRAHKVILKARSTVFSKMFQHDMVEKDSGIIDINDCNPEVIHYFLLYIYTGNLENLTKSNAVDLYYIADKYNVQGITAACVKFMQDNLTIDTFCDFVTLALRHSELSLLETANMFFSKNVKYIIVTPKWKSFIIDYPSEANEFFIKSLTM